MFLHYTERVELFIELRDLGRGDVLDTHRMGQVLDLPVRNAIGEGFLNGRDQRLFRPAPLRDEERDMAALPHLGDQEINRSHPRIDPPGPGPGAVGCPIRAVFPFDRSDLSFGFDPHHLRHDPLEHRQEGIRLGDELQLRLFEG